MLSSRLLEVLVEERKRQGLSQKDMANRMGLRHYQHVQKIEHGKQDTKISTIERYAEALGVNINIELVRNQQ